VEYVAKQDLERPENSWGSIGDAGYVLEEVETFLNNHHFKHEDFNPYEPIPAEKETLSKRFYKIEVE